MIAHTGKHRWFSLFSNLAHCYDAFKTDLVCEFYNINRVGTKPIHKIAGHYCEIVRTSSIIPKPGQSIIAYKSIKAKNRKGRIVYRDEKQLVSQPQFLSPL